MTDIKDKWMFRDRLINAITEDGHFRISVVKATDMLNTAREKHKLNPITTLLLVRLLIGSSLSTSNLKGEERISFRIDSNGEIATVLVEANALGEIRGFISNPQFEPNSKDQSEMISEALGDGFLHFTKVLYGQETPYISSVPLVKSDILSDLSYFYSQSEQLPSALKIDIDFNEDFTVRQAHGLLIQALPDATEEERSSISNHLINFPSLSQLAEQGKYIDEILNSVEFSSALKEMSRRPVDFYCSCSKDRFSNSLENLDKIELIEMSHSDQTMVCHYCNSSYVFSSEELKTIASIKVK